jgi:hypothetical protein
VVAVAVAAHLQLKRDHLDMAAAAVLGGVRLAAHIIAIPAHHLR